MELCLEEASCDDMALRQRKARRAVEAMHEVKLSIARLDIPPHEVVAAGALLSAGEWQRVRRFAFERDQRRFIVARSHLRQLLGAYLGVTPENIELSYGKNGKPELAPRFADSGLRFNLSHSGEVVAFALSRHREVGIDIETVRPLNSAHALVKRFFSQREQDEYIALASDDKSDGFFNCWTRKEAFIKANGNGIYHSLDAFDVSLTPGEPARIYRLGSLSGEQCGWSLHSFIPGPGMIGAVVVEKDEASCHH